MPTTTLGRNATGLRGVSNLMLRVGRGVAARSVSVPLPDDAQISWSAPGGDDTFTGTVRWPDRGIARPDAFTHNMPVRVEDRRTGEIIWQGRVADPGFSGDRHQQEFRLSAVGSGRDLDRIAVLKNYVDRDLSNWTDMHVWPGASSNLNDSSGFIASANDALQVNPEGMLEAPWPQGTTQNTGAVQSFFYGVGLYPMQDLLATGSDSRGTGVNAVIPEVHALRFSWMTGSAGTGSTVEALAQSGAATITLYQAVYTAAGVQNDISLREGISGNWIRTDLKSLYLRQRRTGGAAVPAVDQFIRFANVQVIGKRYNRYGADVTGSTGIEALRPYNIFEDMLGTVLNGRFDPGTIVADTTILIDQASWWAATPVSDILDEANAWNSDFWWGVWAPANPDALPRLDYRPWNTTPRYTLDDTATVQLAGGAEEWSNSALITFLRANGVPSTTRATITVPALNRIFGTSGTGVTASKTRDLAVDLTGKGPMTAATAQLLGTQLLADSAVDRASGSVTVNGPILDDATGRLAQPWEIRPGSPVLVGSTPNQFTSGSPISFDGESTFRLTKVTYSAADDTATLELDGGTRRLSRAAGTGRKYRYWAPDKRRRRKRK